MKRWQTRILICLLLGVVTTVGVAWGCAAVSNPLVSRDAGGTVRQGVSVYWIVWRGIGNTMVLSSKSREREADEPERSSAWWEEPSLPQPLEAIFNPSEAFLNAPDAEPEIGETNLVGATGLPLLSMWYEWGYILGPQSAGHPNLVQTFVQGGIELGLAPWDGATTTRVLPLRPIWPGFLINTLFYGVIWFALFLGFGEARRSIRLRRGLCPKCKYDLRGCKKSGCPECGWNREEAE